MSWLKGEFQELMHKITHSLLRLNKHVERVEPNYNTHAFLLVIIRSVGQGSYL